MTRLLAALALLAALTGCTGGSGSSSESTPSASTTSASPSATPTRASVPRPPTDRACYQLTYDEALAPTSDVSDVNCSKEHTSQTYAVGPLDTVVAGHLLAVDSDQVRDQVATDCPGKLSAFLGGTPDDLHLSMLRSVWFTPTVDESDAGADSFRCDVIAIASDGKLAALAPRMGGVLGSSAGQDRFGMCGTAEPGTSDFKRVICSGQHSWRAVQVVHFSGTKYPGPAAAKDAGQGPCQDAGRAASSNALDFTWGYEWPTREQWDNGQTYGLCWVPD